MRGIGTPAGQAAQNQIWTQTVPMVEIADLPVKAQAKARAAAQVAPQTPVVLAAAEVPQDGEIIASTMSVPTAALGQMIQVGCFADPANAARAGARIAELGLPVSTGVQKGLQMVMAGPFGSAAEAAQGLAALRAAGFGDAFVR